MGEPARKIPREEVMEPDDGEPFVTLLQRWVERPDGRLELLEIPLTPELFLDPQLEDKMVQGPAHSNFMAELKELLTRYFGSRPDVLVLMDVKHFLGPGLSAPSPDISVLQGVRNHAIGNSYDVARVGVLPCLIIEVVSPVDPRIRRTDEVDKVRLYERAGIPEYMLIRPPIEGKDPRFRLHGYHLGDRGRYEAIERDKRERLLSKTTGLRFGVSAEGDRVEIYDPRGRRLRSPREIEKEAEQAKGRAARSEVRAMRFEAKAARAEAAREAAEREIERLRAEVERLKKQ